MEKPAIVVVTSVHTSATLLKERCEMMKSTEIEKVSKIISCQSNISMFSEAGVTSFDQIKTDTGAREADWVGEHEHVA